MLSSKNLLARSLKRSVSAASSSAKVAGRSPLSSLALRPAAPALQRLQQQPARAFSWGASKNSPDDMFKLTSQALIHDISLHQMETVKTVVPWFLSNMPVSRRV